MGCNRRLTLEKLLRDNPLDLGGNVAEQRAIFEQMLAAQPIPDDVRAMPTTLGGIPVVVVDGTDAAIFEPAVFPVKGR